MAPTPSWVKDLKPAGPQGTELLEQERAKSNVNVKALSTFLHTQEGLDRKRTILKILQQEKVFDKSQNYFAGRIDRFETALARAKRLRQLQVKHSWTDTDKQVANELISEPGPYGLHESMFLVCCVMRQQGSGSLLTQLHRSPSVTRARPSSTRSSSSPQETTSTLAVTRRPSSATAPTYEVSRQQPHGAPKTRPSSSTRPP
jgi:hypothetical protein